MEVPLLCGRVNYVCAERGIAHSEKARPYTQEENSEYSRMGDIQNESCGTFERKQTKVPTWV